MPIVFKARVFSVEVDRITFPNGTEHETAIVRHRPSVVLIPVQDDGRVVLVRQYRPSINRFTWELPAGGVEPGESAEHAAVRESVEETRLEPGHVERIGALYPAPGFCDEELIFFRLTELTPPGPGSPYRPDPDEDIEVRTVTPDEARAMVARGDIVDLKTAYGLTLI
jgi:ADP-ribose pyrophosphatase